MDLLEARLVAVCDGVAQSERPFSVDSGLGSSAIGRVILACRGLAQSLDLPRRALCRIGCDRFQNGNTVLHLGNQATQALGFLVDRGEGLIPRLRESDSRGGFPKSI